MRDYDIRIQLKNSLLKEFYSDGHSRIVEEMSIPATKARIDMAVINGFLHAYEIKSSRDTLQRLPHQIEGYCKVFDYISVVTEGKYQKKLLDVLPECVGVYLCSDKETKPQEVRAPERNHLKEGFYVAKLLWHEELLRLHQQFQIPCKKKTRIWLLCESLAANVEIESLSLAVRETLKSRNEWKEIKAGCEVE